MNLQDSWKDNYYTDDNISSVYNDLDVNLPRLTRSVYF